LVKKNIEETQILSEMELKGKWRNRENSFLWEWMMSLMYKAWISTWPVCAA
jgi:hypothetical protein